MMLCHLISQRPEGSSSQSNKNSVRSGSLSSMFLMIAVAWFIATVKSSSEPLQRSCIAETAEFGSFREIRPLETNESFLSSGAAVMGVGSKIGGVTIALKPILLELGVVVLLQSVGLPLISKVAFLARKIQWVSVGRSLGVSANVSNHLRVAISASNRVWKKVVTGYSRTAASKIVTRAKKLVKIFHRGDEDKEPVS